MMQMDVILKDSITYGLKFVVVEEHFHSIFH